MIPHLSFSLHSPFHVKVTNHSEAVGILNVFIWFCLMGYSCSDLVPCVFVFFSPIIYSDISFWCKSIKLRVDYLYLHIMYNPPLVNTDRHSLQFIDVSIKCCFFLVSIVSTCFLKQPCKTDLYQNHIPSLEKTFS